MSRQRFLLRSTAFSIAFLLLSASAWADITGTVWQVPGNENNAPTSAPSGILEGTFTAQDINFFAAGPEINPDLTQTLRAFLNYEAGNLVSTTISGTYLDAIMSGSSANPSSQSDDNACYNHGATSDPSCYSTVIEVTGTGEFVNGASYSVTHDDGVTLSISGSSDVFAGAAAVPTSQETSPFTYSGGAVGPQSFDLWYMATNGNPEVLQSSIPTPEVSAVSTLMIMLTGLAGFVWSFKKKLV
jgi:hypothetical protein